jgi:hypothetical protein
VARDGAQTGRRELGILGQTQDPWSHGGRRLRQPSRPGSTHTGLDRPHDELWWVRKKLREEEINHLPPALAIRKELDEARVRIAAAGTEAEVRRLVAAINDRVVYVNSHVTTGPPSDVVPLDVEQVLADWRRARRGLT